MKEKMLMWAEIIDAHRIVPRVILLAYGYTAWIIIQWFIGLEIPTTEQAAFVSTFSLSSTAVIGLYQNSGRKWGQSKLVYSPANQQENI